MHKGTSPINHQKVRNPRAGKNVQVTRNNEIKGVVKRSFKKTMTPASKHIEKIEEVLNKEVKNQRLKSKKDEEMFILDRMRQLQNQQSDTMQACGGWLGSLNAGSVHLDMDAVRIAQDRRIAEDATNDSCSEQIRSNELIDVYEKIADMQEGGKGTELPKSTSMF